MGVRMHLGLLITLALSVAGLAAQSAAPAADPSAPVNESAFPGKIKLACVGDSITQGSGTTAPTGASNAYPALLQRMLGDKYLVQNFGVGGTTLLNKGDKPYQKQTAFAQSKAFKPDAVVIMLGTNDTKPQNWKFQDEFTADYKDLISQFTALDSKPRIFLCRPCLAPPPGNFGITETNVLLELPLIDALAKDLSLGLIDIHTATLGHEALFPDHVHPNNDGAALLAATVFKTLKGKPYEGPSVIVAPPATARAATASAPAPK